MPHKHWLWKSEKVVQRAGGFRPGRILGSLAFFCDFSSLFLCGWEKPEKTGKTGIWRKIKKLTYPLVEEEEKKKKKKKRTYQPELALKSIPHPGIFGGFGRNVFFLQYGDFIKKPEVLILLSKTTT